MPYKFLDLAQAAQHSGLTVQQLEQAIERGDLVVRYTNNSLRILETELNRFIGGHPPKPEKETAPVLEEDTITEDKTYKEMLEIVGGQEPDEIPEDSDEQ
jgi:GTPase